MRKHKGFTLIELVVVVMILGILAAVAAPKLLNTSNTAIDNGLRQTLNIVRDGIERYVAEFGEFPAKDGSEATFKTSLQPFIRGPFPNSPVGAKNNVVLVVNESTPLTADGTTGWKYSFMTGQFICNFAGTTTIDGGLQYDEL